MPKLPILTPELRTLAIRGIDLEIERLNTQRSALLGPSARGRSPYTMTVQASPEPATTRTRKPMSRAAKAAQSKRMKAYWAAKRKDAK